MSQVKIMANKYSDNYWKEIVDCFEVSSLVIEGIPQDVINVLYGLMGENAVKWVDNPIPLLDNAMARNLVKTEEGYRALKVLLTRMPL